MIKIENRKIIKLNICLNRRSNKNCQHIKTKIKRIKKKYNKKILF